MLYIYMLFNFFSSLRYENIVKMTKVCMLGPCFHLNYNTGKLGKKRNSEIEREGKKGEKEGGRKGW